ncbi:MAG: carboxymuconolactone decarboxylase family protein [Pseudomonadales bacterium]|nr:carboxymuconolactone decarboxylase family protein [Pseudomonadales bacterium]
MVNYTFHQADIAPEGARATLGSIAKELGFIPNLYAGMANVPALLQSYLELSSAFEKSSLSPVERQVVLLTVSVRNSCEFCVAAHSWIARKMLHMPDDIINDLRAGHLPAEYRLAALSAFTQAVVDKHGWVRQHPAFIQFLAEGFRQEQALEVVLGVTQKILSNYTNHLLDTPINKEFSAEAWSREHVGQDKGRTMV